MFNINEEGEWVPQFEQSLSNDDEEKVSILMDALDDHPDVMEIYTNAKQSEK
jgi:transcriptional/translational regulatory protein YebC/TACO1